MRHFLCILLLILVIACGKPTSESVQSATDSLENSQPTDTATLVTITDATPITETPDNEGSNNEADALWESDDQEAEDPLDDALNVYNGEYTLQSSSEAMEGSLTIRYTSGFTFAISITKMVADFCSGTIEGEFSIDEYKTGSFEYDGKPVRVSLTLSGITVEDPERQLGVGTCEYSGTYVNMEGD
jgi:hypothetical protein